MQFHFSTSNLLALAASFAVATAQNAFTMAVLPSVIHAGTPFNITWQATTPGDVSIWLVQGPSSDTKYIATIAANITNEGQYSWTPSSSLQSGPNYALEISSDSNPYITNYSGQFSLDGGSSSVDSSPSSNSTSSSTTASGSSSTGITSSPSSSATGSTASKSTMATVTSSQTGGAASASASSTVPNTSSNGAVRVGASLSAMLVLAVGMFVAL